MLYLIPLDENIERPTDFSTLLDAWRELESDFTDLTYLANLSFSKPSIDAHGNDSFMYNNRFTRYRNGIINIDKAIDEESSSTRSAAQTGLRN
jgi:hypothetical protein